MSIICPTVTANSVDTFNQQLRLIESFAERLHLDFMDGVFAPSISPNISDLNLDNSKILDLHLMYSDPTGALESLLVIKPNLVIIHAEINIDVIQFTSKLEEANIKSGLALLPGTDVNSIKHLLTHVQHVLIFGGHLGYHGGKADLSQLIKVDQIREINKKIEIAWDGGANLDNVNTIASAGVDIINVGGAIHNSAKPKISFLELVNKLKQ